jgi:hypothetical protein
MRKFHVGDVLSVTTRVMLSPRDEEGLRDILAYVSGREELLKAPMEDLIEAAPECEAWLHAQYPWIRPNALVGKDWREWVPWNEVRFGAEMWVQPIPRRFDEDAICLN